MPSENKTIIIDKHLKDLDKGKRQNKKGWPFLIGGVVAVGVVGFMSFGNPSGDSIATPDLPIQVWEIEEKPKTVLVSTEKVEEEIIVATIRPTAAQMARLKDKKEGRKVIRENKKRTKNAKVNQIGLTRDEVTMLEDAKILGSHNSIFKQSDLKKVEGKGKPTRFGKAEIGISEETYSAEEVKDLHMVTTGYIQKVYKGGK